MPDALAPVLALVALLWLAAKIGGELALRLRLPSVAGELAAGLLLGGLHHLNVGLPDAGSNPSLALLGNLGVIVLMFAVGLESTVPQMLKVGLPALRVACLGVLAPMATGFLGALLLLPRGTSLLVDVFCGACLCATSIGISVQVLKEHGAGKSPEGRVIVGAAVIDDVLGLLVLTGVTGAVAASGSGRSLPWGPLALELALALGFLLAACSVGRFLTPTSSVLRTGSGASRCCCPRPWASPSSWPGSAASRGWRPSWGPTRPASSLSPPTSTCLRTASSTASRIWSSPWWWCWRRSSSS
jgi:Kef-type K+ transport system membrane component KefB